MLVVRASPDTVKSQKSKVKSLGLCDSFRLMRALRFRLRRALTRHHLTTDDGFRAQLIADKGFAFHAADDPLPDQDLDFKPQLIAGKNRPAETGLLNASEKHELALRTDFIEQQHSAG